MIDHVGVPVKDVAAARELYVAALEPLGYTVLFDDHGVIGMGAQWPQFWLQPGGGQAKVHVAVMAKDRAAVDAFHAAALAAGATDNGPPGLRDYGPGYYAAYVHDLDGNNIEAVVHEG